MGMDVGVGDEGKDGDGVLAPRIEKRRWQEKQTLMYVASLTVVVSPCCWAGPERGIEIP